MQLGAWSMLTDGFGRHATAIGFGNECMLIAKVASAGLLYVLARRLGISRPGAGAVVLLFGLCPLELVYSRWTFLDNIVTPWMLLAFVLAYSPRRSIAAATGSALAFAMATLSKETALILLPAYVWALGQNLDRRNRSQVIAVAAFCGCLLMALYPLYALYKGELLPAQDRNSLLGTAQWQLLQRQSSGSLLDPHSATAATFAGWLRFDRILLLTGLIAVPFAFFVRRLRPVALALAIGWLALARGGYLPFMHVLTLLPWSALLVVGVLERAAGNGRLAGRRRPLGGWRAGRAGTAVRTLVVAVAAVALGATVVSWAPSLRQMTSVTAEPPLRSAERWVADNVPRNKVLVVHDAIWTDLVQKYGYQPRPIIIYKLDTDPAVKASLHRIDYLVLPNWYYGTPDGVSKYPTAMEARKHAVPVASFGSGDDGVIIYRVSALWRPR
jgi:Dolichyl-phosphate-mannose-protein mannosyltransferase